LKIATIPREKRAYNECIKYYTQQQQKQQLRRMLEKMNSQEKDGGVLLPDIII